MAFAKVFANSKTFALGCCLASQFGRNLQEKVCRQRRVVAQLKNIDYQEYAQAYARK